MSTTEPLGQLQYSQEGRSGTIHFQSPETNFDMWYEFAMPPAIVIIGIPEPRHWEAQTKTPLSRRTEMLRFIGEQVIKDKLSGNGYFLMDDHTLEICPGKNPDDVDAKRQ